MPVAPIDYALDLLERAEALADAAGKPGWEEWSVESDMLRSAWMYIGASVDTYFHNRVRRNMLAQPLSRAAAKFSLPLGDVELLIDAFLANRAGNRPRVALSKMVNAALLRETFQGSSNIEKACGFIGLREYWGHIARELGQPVEDVKKRLNDQYNRRNAISHEGDYFRQDRPQRFWYAKIERADVDDEIAWTRDFLRAIDSI